MSSSYFDHLRCDLGRSLQTRLVEWDVVAGSGGTLLGQAVRLAESGAGHDWMVGYLLRRAHQSILFDGLRAAQVEELNELFETLIALYDCHVPSGSRLTVGTTPRGD